MCASSAICVPFCVTSRSKFHSFDIKMDGDVIVECAVWYCACHMTKNIHRKWCHLISSIENPLFAHLSIPLALLGSVGSIACSSLSSLVCHSPALTTWSRRRSCCLLIILKSFGFLIQNDFGRAFDVRVCVCVCSRNRSTFVCIYAAVSVCKVLEIDLFRVFFNQWKDHPLSSGSDLVRWECVFATSRRKKKKNPWIKLENITSDSILSLTCVWQMSGLTQNQLNWMASRENQTIFHTKCGAIRPNWRRKQC